MATAGGLHPRLTTATRTRNDRALEKVGLLGHMANFGYLCRCNYWFLTLADEIIFLIIIG